jgi:voltage-gated potassium channel
VRAFAARRHRTAPTIAGTLTDFSFRRFGYALAAFFGVLAIGTVGFHAILDGGWVEALYRSVVTTTLTGLDSRPETAAGQLFTIVVLLAGVAIFLYLAGAIVELIARGVVGDIYGERRRRKAIAALTNHTIICGFGRVGRRIAAELTLAGAPFVVIELNPDSLAAAREMEALVIEGDGSEDTALEIAGIAGASVLVASVDSDEKNVFITLSARARRPDLQVIARASSDSAAAKLRMAGASAVVQPYSSAGLEIANLILKPQVAAFLDIASTAGSPELRFEEIEVLPTCRSHGRSLRELRIRDETGANVIAVRKRDGVFQTSPSADDVLEVGDILIGVGTTDEIQRLEHLFAPLEAVG